MATQGIRSAIVAGARSMAALSRTSSSVTTTSKRITSSFLSSPTRPISSASRLASVLGTVDSQKPLHSAIASARLTSILALDTTCWSSLSQGKFTRVSQFVLQWIYIGLLLLSIIYAFDPRNAPFVKYARF